MIDESNLIPDVGDTLSNAECTHAKETTDDQVADAVVQSAVKEEPQTISSKVFLQTEKYPADAVSVFGVSLLGRVHETYDDSCQDYHLFSDLGDGWHLYIVSDGAGSAVASDRGARWNCIITEYLIKGLLERNDWQSRLSLPSELEWYQAFYAVCRKVKANILEKVDMLDEHRLPKDFNATLLVLLVTPYGMLSGHIGDGRMGYRAEDGSWHSLITPHKGEEANQTIFMMNSWDAIRLPILTMSDVSVPETRVVPGRPTAVAVLSDGCENFSWNCTQYDNQTGIYEDRNTPFDSFWVPLIDTILTSRPDERMETFIQFVDTKTDACKLEQDDRSLMLGIYVLSDADVEMKETIVPVDASSTEEEEGEQTQLNTIMEPDEDQNSTY